MLGLLKRCESMVIVCAARQFGLKISDFTPRRKDLLRVMFYSLRPYLPAGGLRETKLKNNLLPKTHFIMRAGYLHIGKSFFQEAVFEILLYIVFPVHEE